MNPGDIVGDVSSWKEYMAGAWRGLTWIHTWREGGRVRVRVRVSARVKARRRVLCHTFGPVRGADIPLGIISRAHI